MSDNIIETSILGDALGSVSPSTTYGGSNGVPTTVGKQFAQIINAPETGVLTGIKYTYTLVSGVTTVAVQTSLMGVGLSSGSGISGYPDNVVLTSSPVDYLTRTTSANLIMSNTFSSPYSVVAGQPISIVIECISGTGSTPSISPQTSAPDGFQNTYYVTSSSKGVWTKPNYGSVSTRILSYGLDYQNKTVENFTNHSPSITYAGTSYITLSGGIGAPPAAYSRIGIKYTPDIRCYLEGVAFMSNFTSDCELRVYDATDNNYIYQLSSGGVITSTTKSATGFGLYVYNTSPILLEVKRTYYIVVCVSSSNSTPFSIGWMLHDTIGNSDYNNLKKTYSVVFYKDFTQSWEIDPLYTIPIYPVIKGINTESPHGYIGV